MDAAPPLARIAALIGDPARAQMLATLMDGCSRTAGELGRAPGISRHHARIEFDGQLYRIVDLDSRNGTYVGEARLEPGNPKTWHAGESARVGDTWLRLESASQGESPSQSLDI